MLKIASYQDLKEEIEALRRRLPQVKKEKVIEIPHDYQEL